MFKVLPYTKNLNKKEPATYTFNTEKNPTI